MFYLPWLSMFRVPQVNIESWHCQFHACLKNGLHTLWTRKAGIWAPRNRIFFVKKGCWGLLPPLYYYWIIFYMTDYPGINALKIHYESNNRFSDPFRWPFRWPVAENVLSFKTPPRLAVFFGEHWNGRYLMHFLRHGFGILAEDGKLWLVDASKRHIRHLHHMQEHAWWWMTGWWFQIFLVFTPKIWGNDPIWLQ